MLSLMRFSAARPSSLKDDILRFQVLLIHTRQITRSSAGRDAREKSRLGFLYRDFQKADHSHNDAHVLSGKYHPIRVY